MLLSLLIVACSPDGPEVDDLAQLVVDDSGEIADDTLVVETHAFRAMPWGIVRGINSSDQMIVTERYKLVDGGLRMDYSYTIEDPVFLREPFTLRKMTMKVPDYAFSSEVCDEETSRRHLQFEAAFAGP